MKILKPAGRDRSRELGPVIRRIRERRALRLKDVADKSGFSESYVSQIERGLVLPSVTALGRLGEALGVSVSQLFRKIERPDAAQVAVIRPGDRKRLSPDPHSRFQNYLLAPDLRRRMEPVLSRARPGVVSTTYSHNGEEFMILLKGTMRIWVGEQVLELAEGDAVYFNSRVPHRWASTGERWIEALWVITPPTW